MRVSSFIDIEDSERVLRAVRRTSDERPSDLILHTPGRLVLAAEQITNAMSEHKGKVTVFIPRYAMSCGTLIALAAREIVMDRNAVFGPVDPQIGNIAASTIGEVVEILKEHRCFNIYDRLRLSVPRLFNTFWRRTKLDHKLLVCRLVSDYVQQLYLKDTGVFFNFRML